jgi:hypothetical protein
MEKLTGERHGHKVLDLMGVGQATNLHIVPCELGRLAA